MCAHCDDSKPEFTLLQVLEACEYALNMVRNTRLKSCPHGFKDTYELVKAVEVQRYFREQNKDDADV